MIAGRTFLRRIAVIGIGWIAFSLAVHPAAAQTTPVLSVNAGHSLGKINPFVYGVNYGPWSFLTPDLIPLAQASGVSYLRFPAGNWGDQNDLMPFDIDLFMDLAHKLKAEPSISVRLSGGTPKAAAELVRYANIQSHYGVRYWSIGNEPDLYDNYSVDQYNRDWRAFATAMLAVDPTIRFVGPDISQYAPPQMTDSYSQVRRDWVGTFLKVNGDLVSVVSVHRYPFPKKVDDPPATIAQLKDSASEWDSIIPDIRKTIVATTGRDLPIAVTEVNSHWNIGIGGATTPDSFYHAIWWADVLGRMIRQRVAIVAYFTLNTSGTLGTYGLLSAYDARPTYYVYSLYQKFGSQLVESLSSDPDVTVTAATRSDGDLTLMIVNSAAAARSLTFGLSGFSATAQTELWRFDVDHNAARIGTTSELTTGTVTLPAQSISLYTTSGAPSAAATSPSF